MAKGGMSEPEVETDGWLSEVSKFVEVKTVHTEIRNLINKATILAAHTKVVRDMEIGSAAVHECATGLSFRPCSEISVGRIEHQRATACEGVWPDA